MNEPTRRVFFALWPDEAVRVALAHATRKAVRGCGGRPVPVENLHATLLFLGSVAESRIADLVAVGMRVASAAEIVAARAGGASPDFIFDCVDFWAKAHVLVATASAESSPALTLARALAGVLQRETGALGFAPDPMARQLRPHVTLARKVHRPPRYLTMEPVTWGCTDFVLVDSKTLPTGPVYIVLERFRIGC
jgi:2'-5' RNA ligase